MEKGLNSLFYIVDNGWTELLEMSSVSTIKHEIGIYYQKSV